MLSDKMELTRVHIILEVLDAFLEGFHYRNFSIDILFLPRKHHAQQREMVLQSLLYIRH